MADMAFYHHSYFWQGSLVHVSTFPEPHYYFVPGHLGYYQNMPRCSCVPAFEAEVEVRCNICKQIVCVGSRSFQRQFHFQHHPQCPLTMQGHYQYRGYLDRYGRWTLGGWRWKVIKSWHIFCLVAPVISILIFSLWFVEIMFMILFIEFNSLSS